MAFLVLSNGMIFEGQRIGAPIDRIGELVFTTGMEGYLETLTDPSYYGQIVTQTFPLIGNYGVIEEDFEGKSALFGYIVRELCSDPSNFRSQYPLEEYLRAKEIPGLCGVDTREIVRVTREEGVMNALICEELPDDVAELRTQSLAGTSSPALERLIADSPTLKTLRAYTVQHAVSSVTCADIQHFPAEGKEKHRVALIDYGAKRNILRSLQSRGCAVTVYPASTPAEDILASNPDGIMLSNGPGDPTENTFAIDQIRQLMGQRPIFGICLGHQLAALALGGQTIKLKYGHRGGNQPVRDLASGRTYITSQNHGYAVVASSLQGIGQESFQNANDQSCEGMEYPSLNCFTVQFHPEAASGPRDTAFLFDRFIDRMGGIA